MATQQIKNILNTEVPSPSFVISPSVPVPLPSKMPSFGESGTGTGRSGQDNVARTLDPYSGKFEHVPENTPRVYGSEQDLLIESSERRNQLRDSSDFDSGSTAWTDYDNDKGTSASSIIRGQTARKIEADGTGTVQRFQKTPNGFSGSSEVYYSLLEAGSSLGTKIGLKIFDTTTTSLLASVFWDLKGGDVTVDNNSKLLDKNFRIVKENGPNGGSVVEVMIRYSRNAGNGRRAYIESINTPSSGESFYIHHTQIEENSNRTSPIVTQSSTSKRSSDNYKIFSGGVPDWWNRNEGTFFVEFVSQSYVSDKDKWLLAKDVNNQYLGLRKNNNEVYIYDGSSALEVNKSFTPFTENKIAVSFTESKKTISLNGEFNSASSNGSLTISSALYLARNDSFNGTIKKLYYYPRALSGSKLNVITS